MKIVSLKFMNLNSLYGEWSIDFTHPEFLSNGLFAITGPTGAGKSTIMDAICLALYGETPRLGKITSSGNEIMSRQTGECYAEVVFESQSGRFRCQWRQHRARKKPEGKLAEASHELSDAVTDQLLESKKRDVAAAIEARTGMDFERFTRSILLAQGSFSAFLKASPDERSPILEQITGTQIYSDLSIAVHERQKAEKQALEALQQQIQGVPILSEEEETQLLFDLQQQMQEEQTLAQKQQENAAALSWRENLQRLDQELVQLTSDKEKLDQQNQTMQPQRRQLSDALRAQPLESDYASLTLLRTEQSKEQNSLQDLEQARPQLEQAVQASQAAHFQAEQDLKTAQNVYAAAQPSLQQTRQLDWTISSQATTLASQETQLKQLAGQIEQAQKDLKQHQEKWTTAQAQQASLTAIIEQTAADEPLVTQIAGITAHFIQIRTTQDDIAGREEELKKIQFQLSSQEQVSKEKSQVLEKLAQQIKLEQENLDTLKQQLLSHLAGRSLGDYRTELTAKQKEARLVRKILDLDSERKRLVDGQPCPLCGATDHPYALGNVPELDEVEQQIDQLTQFIDQADRQSQQIADQAEHITQQQDAFQVQERQVQQAQADWRNKKTLAEQLSKDHTAQLDKLQHQLAAGLAQTAPFGISELQLDQLGAILSDLQARSESRKKMTGEHLALKGQIDTIQHQIELIKQRLETMTQSNRQLNDELTAVRQDLASIRQQRLELLGNLDPNAEDQRLQMEIDVAAQTEKATRDDAAAKARLLENNRLAQTTLAAQLESRQKQLTDLAEAWTSLLTGAGFATEADFLACRLSAAEHTRLQTLFQELDGQLAAQTTKIQDRSSQKSQLLAEARTVDSLHTLQEKHSELDQARKAIQQKLGELQGKQSVNQAAREKVRAIQEVITKQQTECRKWDRLHVLIGSADGKKYRNFAQGLTFERMVHQANLQLGQMTDRYLLVRDAAEPLQLNVIDNYQAGEIRTTRNLSGGESFIVSLALALGLSKMASRNVRVDSLFLDEGFGTLDDDALETALETLSSLQAENKLIGVISHVPALKERISTQLRIQTQSGGKSVISGPGVERLHNLP